MIPTNDLRGWLASDGCHYFKANAFAERQRQRNLMEQIYDNCNKTINCWVVSDRWQHYRSWSRFHRCTGKWVTVGRVEWSILPDYTGVINRMDYNKSRNNSLHTVKRRGWKWTPHDEISSTGDTCMSADTLTSFLGRIPQAWRADITGFRDVRIYQRERERERGSSGSLQTPWTPAALIRSSGRIPRTKTASWCGPDTSQLRRYHADADENKQVDRINGCDRMPCDRSDPEEGKLSNQIKGRTKHHFF